MVLHAVLLLYFAGMGEPLHNMTALMPALDIICHPQGLALSRSKVIVSTVGLVPQLRQLRASGKAKLAVSLHATTDEVRSWIVPTNRKHPLNELIGALRELYPLPASANRSSSSSSSSSEAGSRVTSSSSSSSSSSASEAPQQQQQQQRSARSDDFVVIECVLLKDVNDTGGKGVAAELLLQDARCTALPLLRLPLPDEWRLQV
jgi:adenine C2-methylase RlmN of 23S rRNA A2503 and tRNA A37